MKNPLITIGESIHASIPKTGTIMKQLAELARRGGRGSEACSRPTCAIGSGPLNYIKGLIESQAADGADYIAVNLDAFGEDGSAEKMNKAMELMGKLCRENRKGA